MRALPTTAALLLTGLAACSSGGDPRDVALRFDRAAVAGDVATLRAMLSHDDSAQLARPEAAEIARSFATPGKGRAATTVDSARVGRRSGDSAFVAVYLTAPNWESVGGQFTWEGTRSVDRAEDLALARSLPRVTEVDTVALVLERRGAFRREWRAARDIAGIARVTPFLRAAMSFDSALAYRASGAARYLADFAARGRPLDPMTDSTMRALVAGAALAESLSYRVELRDMALPWPGSGGLPGRALSGYVVNRSRRAIAHVEIRAVLTSGEVAMGSASDIAPGDSGKVFGPGNWRGHILRHAITAIDPAP